MKKVFHELSSKEQDEIRRKYKRECSKDYKYSIHLYIIYVILGILSVLGIGLVYYDFMMGLVLFTISFILMGIVVYFLYLSNKNFIRFLKRINMKYEED